jgi:hypothetical protein
VSRIAWKLELRHSRNGVTAESPATHGRGRVATVLALLLAFAGGGAAGVLFTVLYLAVEAPPAGDRASPATAPTERTRIVPPSRERDPEVMPAGRDDVRGENPEAGADASPAAVSPPAERGASAAIAPVPTPEEALTARRPPGEMAPGAPSSPQAP